MKNNGLMFQGGDNNVAPRNNGLMMNGNMNGNVEKEEKRTFTNSKKIKIEDPVLDPNVPTASNNKAAVTKVSLSTWD